MKVHIGKMMSTLQRSRFLGTTIQNSSYELYNQFLSCCCLFSLGAVHLHASYAQKYFIKLSEYLKVVVIINILVFSCTLQDYGCCTLHLYGKTRNV